MKKLFENWKKFVQEAFDDVGWQKGTKGTHWGNAGSGILLVTPQKEYFLALRSPSVDQPNTWGLVGGAIPEDEETGKRKDPWTSAVHEMNEECGSLPPGFPDKGQLFQNDVDESFTFYNYLVQVPDKAKKWKVRHSWESVDSGWFTAENLPSPLHFGVKWLLKRLKVL